MHKITMCLLAMLSFSIAVPAIAQFHKMTEAEISQLIEASNELVAKAREKKRLNNNRNIVAIVRLVVDKNLKNSEFAESLGFTEKQLADVEAAFEEFEETLNSGVVDSNKLFSKDEENYQKVLASEAKQKLLKEFNEILLPHQLSYVSQMDVTRVGLPKLLTQSPIGDILELTDGQKRRIKHQSEALAQKVEKFIHESRHEAFAIIFDELEDEQKGKLFKLYDEKLLKRQMSTMPMRLLYAHFVYELPDGFDKNMSPSIIVMGTNVEDKSK